MNRSYSAPLFWILALTLTACSAGNRQQSQPTPSDQRATDESTIRGLDGDWLKAVVAKDATLATSFYADGASVLAPGAPLATGKDAIQKAWAGLMGTPGFALTFDPAKIEVSRGGDLAYELGDYQLTTNDKQGKPQTLRGKYVVVWGKQPGGDWKALVDAPTTTQ
jgi:ketosteroid isomerase-like protein